MTAQQSAILNSDLDQWVQDLIEKKLVHEIHTSERRSFRACRRRWDWIFRQNYYPLITAKPLEFGIAYHAGMEVFYDPEKWDWDREVVGELAVNKFVDTCEAQKQAALEAQDRVVFDVDVEEDYEERVELGKGMMRYYFNEVCTKIDVGWRPVKVEIGFMVTIPNPETDEKYIWCKCNQCWDKWVKYNADPSNVRPSGWYGLPVVYAGRCDMIAVDQRGNYWVFDWKTARSIADQYEFLYLDDQIGSYVWALRKIGLNIRGFVYHEQRKGFPQEPKKNVNRRLGRLYSVARNQDVDYDTYLACVSEKDKEAYEEGLYDEYLEFLKEEGIVYFSRHQIAKSDYECNQIEQNIGFEALDIIDPNLRIYPSAGRFGCSFCAFRQPCMEKNDGSDYQYALDTLYEKREHYYVRQEASTESKGGE